MTGLLIIALIGCALYLRKHGPDLFKPARTANEQARKPHAQQVAETGCADPRHSSPQVARVKTFYFDNLEMEWPNA